ncbi:carbohydrate kinase, YjeF related protein, partial [mine drainage metagenome]
SGLHRPLSAEEMGVVEANAVGLGVPLDTLMERAGRAVAEEAAAHLPPAPAAVAVIAGSGNNGGDGTCAAHYLLDGGTAPEVWLLRPPSQIGSHSARRCWARIERRLPIHVGVPTATELAAFPLLIDGMLGTGQTGPLRDPYRAAAGAMTASRAPVLSVDLPTGTRDPAGLHPTWTVALTAPKSEMDPTTAGTVTVRDIGIPPAAWFETGPGEFRFFPSSRLEHDGRRSRVIVVGGGPYAGAPALAGLAALRSGAERATVVAPGGAARSVQSFSPDLVVEPIGGDRFAPTDVPAVTAFVEARHPQAVVLGMGVGAAPETIEAMGLLVRAWAGRRPMVVDADALRALGGALPTDPGPAPLVVTPNSGEFRRDFGGPAGADPAARRQHVTAAAERRGVTIVAKGDPDVISDGPRTVENRRHSPYQTVAGAGDILAGVLGHLLAEGLDGIAAGRLATYWVGEAGIR